MDIQLAEHIYLPSVPPKISLPLLVPEHFHLNTAHIITNRFHPEHANAKASTTPTSCTPSPSLLPLRFSCNPYLVSGQWKPRFSFSNMLSDD
jgi:hypothetical protein